MVYECSDNHVYLRQVLKCNLTVNSAGQILKVLVDYGDGNNNTFFLNDTTLYLPKSYRSTGNFTIKATIMNISLTNEIPIIGNLKLIV